MRMRIHTGKEEKQPRGIRSAGRNLGKVVWKGFVHKRRSEGDEGMRCAEGLFSKQWVELMQRADQLCGGPAEQLGWLCLDHRARRPLGGHGADV